MRKKITDQKAIQIFKKVTEGETQEAIAKDIGVDRGTLSRFLKKPESINALAKIRDNVVTAVGTVAAAAAKEAIETLSELSQRGSDKERAKICQDIIDIHIRLARDVPMSPVIEESYTRVNEIPPGPATAGMAREIRHAEIRRTSIIE